MSPPRNANIHLYKCPQCQHWYGQHLTTGTLSRHKEPGGDTYELCHGSLVAINGLPHQRRGVLVTPVPDDDQDGLFPIAQVLRHR